MLMQRKNCSDLIGLLETRASEMPEKPMYSFLDRRLECTTTFYYRAFFESAKQLAAVLQRTGLSRTPVLVLQPDPKEFVLSFWACVLAGAWPMPYVRPRGVRWQQIESVMKQSEMSAILTTSVVANLIPDEVLADIDLVLTDDASQDQAHWIRPRVEADDIAFIQYTSGSTSNPKGVVITHRNILANLQAIHEAFSCSSEDTGLSWLPLHHDMGLVGHVLEPCFAGIHNYFMRPADFVGNPSGWLEAIHRYRATISGGPCFAYALCLREQKNSELDLSCWRLAYCGSQKIITAVLQQFAESHVDNGFDPAAWFPCYGLAESTLFVGGVKGVHTRCVPGQGKLSIAIAADNRSHCQIRIVDPITGLLCAEGKKGEIWIRSASVSPGYYNNREQNLTCFDQFVNGEGQYFRTGDLGFVCDGLLYFSGREKNLLKLRGRSIHGEDIESIVQHEVSDLGIAQCVVVPHSIDYDETFSLLVEWSERHRPAAVPSPRTIESKIRNLVCDTFSVFPHRILFLPRGTLPLTTSGKPARTACLALLEQYLESEQEQRAAGGRQQTGVLAHG
ncbi:MAG TPA: AMP-binding protein [Pseudohongiella sp.]|nr:AMP-binding protein [Pseudohongiella sp.]